jgi:hypothetical protein
MPTISTYQLTPHLPVNSKGAYLNTLNFREMVNKLVRDKWDKLVVKGADPSLFFNHDTETGKTRVGYPLVIYHFIDHNFYITGINKGSDAVEMLAKLYKIPFGNEGLLFPGFRKLQKAVPEIKCLPETKLMYRLVKWIPFNYKDYRQFEKLPFAEKVSELNQRLRKHIEADLAKYLELDTDQLNVIINNLEYNYTEPVLYEDHKYHACDIKFTTNIKLPRFITLGNIKSLGFGRIEPL